MTLTIIVLVAELGLVAILVARVPEVLRRRRRLQRAEDHIQREIARTDRMVSAFCEGRYEAVIEEYNARIDLN